MVFCFLHCLIVITSSFSLISNLSNIGILLQVTFLGVKTFIGNAFFSLFGDSFPSLEFIKDNNQEEEEDGYLCLKCILFKMQDENGCSLLIK